MTPLKPALLATALLAVANVPAQAQSDGPDYRATTAAPITERKVAGETMWRCTDGSCVAQKAYSRPDRICSQLAREVGKLESFSYKGKPFAADALDKCNQRAR